MIKRFPDSQALEPVFTRRFGVIRNVMHKTVELKKPVSGFKTRFTALVLLERVQLPDVEKPARRQDVGGLPEDKVQILNMF